MTIQTTGFLPFNGDVHYGEFVFASGPQLIAALLTKQDNSARLLLHSPDRATTYFAVDVNIEHSKYLHGREPEIIAAGKTLLEQAGSLPQDVQDKLKEHACRVLCAIDGRKLEELVIGHEMGLSDKDTNLRTQWLYEYEPASKNCAGFVAPGGYKETLETLALKFETRMTSGMFKSVKDMKAYYTNPPAEIKSGE